MARQVRDGGLRRCATFSCRWFACAWYRRYLYGRVVQGRRWFCACPGRWIRSVTSGRNDLVQSPSLPHRHLREWRWGNLGRWG